MLTAPPSLEERVAGILTSLGHACSADARCDGLGRLCEIVDAAFGEDGMAIGRAIRRDGVGLALLAHLATDEDADVRLQALHLIANLCSDAVDPGSASTKIDLLAEPAGASAIAESLRADDTQVVLLACGALQNLCTNREWCRVATERALLRRLEELLGFPDAMMRRYSAGALKNIIQAAHRDLESGGVEEDWSEVWLSEEALMAVDHRAFQVLMQPQPANAAPTSPIAPQALRRPCAQQ